MRTATQDMPRMPRTWLAWLTAGFLAAASCREGPGGPASLTGRVIAREFDVFGELVREYPAQDEEVFIIYGDDSIYGDDTNTNFDGSYRFDYLRQGHYRVFAYADCLSCPGDQEVVFLQVEIPGRHDVRAPDLFIRKD